VVSPHQWFLLFPLSHICGHAPITLIFDRSLFSGRSQARSTIIGQSDSSASAHVLTTRLLPPPAHVDTRPWSATGFCPDPSSRHSPMDSPPFFVRFWQACPSGNPPLLRNLWSSSKGIFPRLFRIPPSGFSPDAPRCSFSGAKRKICIFLRPFLGCFGGVAVLSGFFRPALFLNAAALG